MEQEIFEILKKVSTENKGKQLDSKTVEKYKKLIKECNSDEELSKCFNSKEIHPRFWDIILRQYLQIEKE